MSRVLRMTVVALGFLAIGGTVAWATGVASFGFVGSDGTITACVQTNTGNVRFRDTSETACRTGETAVTFNQRGPTGEAGPPGQSPGPAAVTVNCPAQSINQTLDDNANATRLDITVNGTCAESVGISRDDVSIHAGSSGGGIAPPTVGDCAICMNGASNIFVDGLTLTGGGLSSSASNVFVQDVHITGAGTAVGVGGGASVAIRNVTIDSCQEGLNASFGTLFVSGGSITGCQGFAVSAHDGGSITLSGGLTVANSNFQAVIAGYGGTIGIRNATIDGAGNTTVFAFGGSISVSGSNTLVTDSSFCGVAASDGGNASVTGGARVSGNHGGGVCANNGGHLLIQDGGIVENNTFDGVRLVGASSLRMRGNAIVRNNTARGVSLSDTSVAEFQDGTSQITGNGGWGIWCDGPPSVAVIRGDPGNVSGNGGGQNNCQNAGF